MITFGRAAIRFVMDLTKSTIHPSSTTKTLTPRGKTKMVTFALVTVMLAIAGSNS